MVPVKVTLLLYDDFGVLRALFVLLEYFRLVKRVAGTNWKYLLLLVILTIMSTVKDSFISEPLVSGLRKLKRSELIEVAGHYKLTCQSSMKKDEIRQVILEHLHEEDLFQTKKRMN